MLADHGSAPANSTGTTLAAFSFVSTSFGDYKTVDGVTMAYSMESHIKGKEAMGGQALTIQKVELNPKIDKAIFAMPAPAAPKPAEGEPKKN